MANISNSVSNTLITGTNDDDTIENLSGGKYVTIESAGKDYITNRAKYVLINANDDFIVNHGGETTINAASGKNTIISMESGYEVVINGSDGDDDIDCFGEESTINAGNGNDTISAAANIVLNLGNGNNYIMATSIWGIPTINTAGGDDIISFNADIL